MAAIAAAVQQSTAISESGAKVENPLFADDDTDRLSPRKAKVRPADTDQEFDNSSSAAKQVPTTTSEP
jgi:hypothetical protein